MPQCLSCSAIGKLRRNFPGMGLASICVFSVHNGRRANFSRCYSVAQRWEVAFPWRGERWWLPVITLDFSYKCFPSRFPNGEANVRGQIQQHIRSDLISLGPPLPPAPHPPAFFSRHQTPSSRNPRTRSPSADCEHLLEPINNASCSHSEGKMPRASFVLPPSENNILTFFFSPSFPLIKCHS